MTEKKSKADSKKPLKTVRSGAIGASIWLETGAEGAEYFAITISRSWKSKSSGKEGYSSKFFPRNREQLREVIDLACDAVESLERSENEAPADQLVA